MTTNFPDDAAHPERIVLITGASRGIGRVLARTLGAEGASVVVNYVRNADLAQETAALVREAGGQATTIQADMEDPAQIEAMFAQVKETYGRLDAFVANAAASAFKPVSQLRQHHLDRNYAMNLRSFVMGANLAASLMDRGGRIVVVTSYGTERVFPTYASLGAAKAAEEAYARYMAVEYGPRGITVNAVNGGLIDTDSLDFFYHRVPGMAPMRSVLEKVPLRRPGTAQDMADAIAFLLSDKASYITGQVIKVDGGLTVIAPPFWEDTTGAMREAVLGEGTEVQLPASAVAREAADAEAAAE